MKRQVLTFSFFLAFLTFLFAAPSWAWWRQAKVVSSTGEVKKIDWNDWELHKDPAKRDLGQTEQASFHIIRLQGIEPEHTHDTHELVATVLKGTGKVHFGSQSFDIQKGDVVRIPKGVPHWVENTGTDALEAYAVFMPPFDGKDFRLVGSPADNSSYRV